MDYKKKYEDALKRAKAIIKVAANQDGAICFANTIFPELKENEDERIIKALKEGFKYHQLFNPTFGGIPCVEIVNWLEKQGEQKSLDDVAKEVTKNKETAISFLKSCGIMNANGELADEYKIEQGVQKLADKVEPKFKVGDWITNGRYAKLIVGINSDWPYYMFKDGTSKWIKDIDKKYHLWTIKDAKNGDFLAAEDKNFTTPFVAIYKERGLDFFNSHCFIGFNGNFYKGEEGHDIENIHPATKEQRDLLFQNMKEEGYEWDAERKELKKIEDEEYNGEDYGIDSLYHAQRILEKTLGKVDGYQTDDGILSHKCAITAVKKLYEQKPTWTEKDEKTWKELIEEMKDQLDSVPAPDCRDKEDEKVLKQLTRWLVWLKSIKDRVQPKQEWSEEDEKTYRIFIQSLVRITANTRTDSTSVNYTFSREIDWLKSLKQRIGR